MTDRFACVISLQQFRQTRSTLVDSIRLPCGAVLKNRIVKSATSETAGTIDNRPTDGLSTLYQTWADGGAGLLITGNVMVDRQALSEPRNVALEDASDLAAFQKWAQAGRSQGAHIWMQINHPGKQAPRVLNDSAVSPSPVPMRRDMQALFAPPTELTETDILLIITRFAKSAKLAKEAGFTGVQIHGAHGYLVSQFLSPHHNRRTDRWGGSADKRCRFVLEVYRAIRHAVGDTFPVGIKLNSADFQQEGLQEDEALQIVERLSSVGMDLIEISGGTYEAAAMSGIFHRQSTLAREAYFLAFAEHAREVCPTPLMVTGGFRTVAAMNQALQTGAVDMVGLARLLIMEPDAPWRLLQGLDPIYRVRAIKTGLRWIDDLGMMEIAWYEGQLRRMAQGKPPIPDESAWRSLLGVLFTAGLGGWQTRRLRMR